MTKVPRNQVPSLRGAARKARTADDAQRKKLLLNTVSRDSFQNFMAKFGIGTDNLTSAGTYGFNPITRQRTILEWAHRGNWLSGCAVDIIADDMTRAGVDIVGNLKPEQIEQLETAAVTLKLWDSINQTIKWARLYGGAIGVLLIDGQDVSTPLRVETVGRGQFKGILPLDRWMLEPDLQHRVRTLGPDLGMPEWYKVMATAPAFAGQRIHYTRVLRMVGVELPYWQSMMENLWGVTVLERLWDRQLAFDSSTTGIAQLIYKCYLRTLKVAGLRDLVSTGTEEQQAGLARYVDATRKFQSVEGFTLIDGEDEFGEHTGASVSCSGIGEAMTQIGQQLSGALEMPLTRLFGQAPAGLNATGESDMRNYYDGINHRQKRQLQVPVTTAYRCLAMSEGIAVDDGFGITFRPLWQLTDTEKADIAQKTSEAVGGAYDRAIISPKTALQELRQSAKTTGVFSNITDEDIEAADDEPVPPASEGTGAEGDGEGEEDALPVGVTMDASMRVPADKAGYVELPGAVKDGDCNVVAVQGGVSLQKGCCNNFSLGTGAPKQFKCGSCKFHTDKVGVFDKRSAAVVAAADGGTRRIAARDDMRRVAALAWNHGLQAVVENPAGSVRSGRGWSARMAADYGYLRTVPGADGDQLDCFIGAAPESEVVFVINQKKRSTGAFDEHKVMFGYVDKDDMMRDFIASHDEPSAATERIMNVVKLSMPSFKKWIKDGDLSAPLLAATTEGVVAV